jgi:N-acetylmuramoyl-L-alanine amidase
VNAFNAWNTVLAGTMHRRLLAALQCGDRGEKFEHLGVLRGLRCPGVLVEPAFLSSDAEGARLAAAAYRESIARAIFEGIEDYAALVRALRATEPAPAPAAGVPALASGRVQPTRPSAP